MWFWLDNRTYSQESNNPRMRACQHKSVTRMKRLGSISPNRISPNLFFWWADKQQRLDLSFFSSLIWQALFCRSSFFSVPFLGRPLSCKLKLDPLRSLSSVEHRGCGQHQLSDSWESCLFLPSLPYMHLPAFSCLTMITIRNIINLQIWFGFMFKYFLLLFCMAKVKFKDRVTSQGKAMKQNRCGGWFLCGWCSNKEQ